MPGGRHTPSFNLQIQQRGAGARNQQLSQLILSLYVILPCVGLPSTCLVDRPGQKRALCPGFPVSGTCVRQSAVHPACNLEAP